MKKLFLILLYLISHLSSFAQVHGPLKFPYSSKWTDSIDANGKNILVLKPDSTLRLIGALTASQDITTQGNINGQKTTSTYSKVGSLSSYVATVILVGKITSTNTYVSIAHGLPNYRNIVSMNMVVEDVDSSVSTNRRILKHGV